MDQNTDLGFRGAETDFATDASPEKFVIRTVFSPKSTDQENAFFGKWNVKIHWSSGDTLDQNFAKKLDPQIKVSPYPLIKHF